jgi:hypothetical protein
MANKPTPQIDPLPGMGPLGIPKPQTDERGRGEYSCSDKCQEIHILADPELPPSVIKTLLDADLGHLSYTKHAAECAIGQRESEGAE